MLRDAGFSSLEIKKIIEIRDSVCYSCWDNLSGWSSTTVSGKFKKLPETFQGHDVFLITELTKNNVLIKKHKNYRVGSKIWKDYDERCPKGHYLIRVIEY